MKRSKAAEHVAPLVANPEVALSKGKEGISISGANMCKEHGFQDVYCAVGVRPCEKHSKALVDWL